MCDRACEHTWGCVCVRVRVCMCVRVRVSECVCVCVCVYEWVSAWDRATRPHLIPILMSMTAGSSNSLSKSVISTYTDAGWGVKDSNSCHSMDTVYGQGTVEWAVNELLRGWNFRHTIITVHLQPLCSVCSHQRDQGRISAHYWTLEGGGRYGGDSVCVCVCICLGEGGKQENMDVWQALHHLAGLNRAPLRVWLCQDKDIAVIAWEWTCVGACINYITSQNFIMWRILPSSCSTTFLNSATNGLKTSSIIALSALRSFASDFFIIVPLSSPALKLPAWEGEGEVYPNTDTS